MADKKISALTAASTPLAGTEVLPIVQGGSTVKVSIANVTVGRDINTKNVIATGQGVFAGPLDNFWAASGGLYGYYSGGGVFGSYSNASGTLSPLSFDGSTVAFRTANVSRLEISNGGDVTAKTGNLVVGTAGKGITTGSAIPLGFGVNNTAAAMTIDTASNVGVGTASPATRVHAQSSASNTTFRATSELSGSFYYSGFEVNRSGTAGGALMRASRDAAQGGAGWEWLVTADNAAEVSGTYTNGMTLDTLGNLKVANSIRVGTTGTIFSEPYTVPGNIQTWFVNNATPDDTYIASDTAQRFRVLSGIGYQWQLAGSGTAGGAVSYTTAMTLDLAGNLGIGTSPAATAILDVQSTTKGVRFPNMTTAQKNAITPSAGTVVFDTTLSKLCVYSGAAWQTITSV